jgi:hypothetical protein
MFCAQSGLRRTFSLRGKTACAPAGAIAQVMGHVPSLTTERCRPRSLDTLNSHLERTEAHLLEQADSVLDAKTKKGTLRFENTQFVNQGLTH